MPLSLFVTMGLLFAQPIYAEFVTLAYTANRQGETKPCGCKIREIGGLPRMEARIGQLKKAGAVLFVDSGNAFFKAPKLSPGRLGDAKRQAELIAESYKRMGLKVFSPGERDFGAGIGVFWQLVKRTGAVPLSANLESLTENGQFAPFLIWDEGGVRLALIGLTSFDSGSTPDQLRIKDPKAAMRDVWKSIQESKPQQVIVLSHLGSKIDEEIAKEFPGVWIVGSKSMDYYDAPKKVAQSFLFEAGIEGQRLGEVLIEKNKDGWKTSQLTELGDEYDIPKRKSRAKK